MARLHLRPDTDQVVAHIDGVRSHVNKKAHMVAAVAAAMLAARPRVRTGASQVIVTQGTLDSYVGIKDRPDGVGKSKPDEIAAIISFQHSILWDAVNTFAVG